MNNLLASAAAAEAAAFVAKVNDVLLFPLIALLTGVALLVFIYGGAEYILGASNETAREQGKKHLTYSFIGFVVMLSAYAILSIAAGTFGLNDTLDCATDSTAPGCDDWLAPPSS